MNKLINIAEFRILSILILFFTQGAFSQETLPVYSDYLTDNVYLIHPAAAGIGDCSKIRMTGRQQWMDINDAPELQTLSIHTRLGDNNGIGFIAFNDNNGHHAKVGGELTYAYHINLDPYLSKQFSFGISALAIRTTLDETSWLLDDPVNTQQINSTNYFNADAGIAYHHLGLSSYLTVKNLLPMQRALYSDSESQNLRRYLLGGGYFFNTNTKIKFEPSLLLQYVEYTKESFADANLKMYYPFDNGYVWGGLSYRRSLSTRIETANFFVPNIGINLRRFVVSYAYTHQQNNGVFANGGHQITLGYNFLCREKPERQGSCPNIDNGF